MPLILPLVYFSFIRSFSRLPSAKTCVHLSTYDKRRRGQTCKTCTSADRVNSDVHSSYIVRHSASTVLRLYVETVIVCHVGVQRLRVTHKTCRNRTAHKWHNYAVHDKSVAYLSQGHVCVMDGNLQFWQKFSVSHRIDSTNNWSSLFNDFSAYQINRSH